MTFIKTFSIVALVAVAVWASGFIIALVELAKPDLGDLGDFLTGVGTIGLLGAAVFGSIFLPSKIEEKRLDFARREQNRATRFKVAMDTFTAFSNALFSMKRIRANLVSFPAEDAEKYRGVAGSARYKIELMKKELPTWHRLEELKPTFEAIFNDASAFDEFLKALAEVHTSVSTLAYDHFTDDDEDHKFFKKLQNDMWERHNGTDPISPRLEAAFQRIKDICIPEIRQDAS